MALSPVYTEKAECQDCYKCLRECPLKSIGFSSGVATILLEECVSCGNCTRICPVKAKRIRNDLPKVKKILASNEKVYASIAPAVISEFPNTAIGTLFAAIKSLGFAGVYETAFGADMASASVAAEIKAKYKTQKLFISTACPSIVSYIRYYQPNLVQYLTEAPSPLYFHAKSLKQQYGEDAKVVFIGPCASKKNEADQWPDLISAAIGFSDLIKWFAEEKVDLSSFATQSVINDSDRPSKGLLYPFDSGMCRSLKTFDIEKDIGKLHYLSLSGLAEIRSALSTFDVKSLESPVFLELLSCKGGCINGPMSREAINILGKQLIVESHEGSLQKRELKNAVDAKIDWKPCEEVHQETVPIVEIQKALRKVGKISPSDELNCSGCGYDSCRDFAKALAQKKADPTMCVSYMKTLAQKRADGVMRSIPSGVVIVDSDLRVIDCNYNFAKLLGEEAESLFEISPGLNGAILRTLIDVDNYLLSVLHDPNVDLVTQNISYKNLKFHANFFNIEKGVQVGIILQDFTIPWIRRDRIIEQAQKVIEKNMLAVQNIAYLLGENAAETEVILNSMISSFSQKDDISEKQG